MQTWVALFRGINVGGKNKMPMAKLKALLESLHCSQVRTYIQSGNVIFASGVKNKHNLENRILDATESEFGFRPKLVLLSESEFSSALRKNPFPIVDSDPRTLHFFFLDAKPESPDHDGIATLAAETERYQLIDKVFYFYAPDRFAGSKLAAAAERKLGVTATARNYATVQKLAAMLAES